ncbi:anti-sigma factor antagonist [Gemmobacter aquarius]|uniref:Anti-sigma factor antagonist n=1 Tax=Paragemmobacter aquarius TaxID=2169400 RepID=A0A2S0UME3_9RHOB|nr:STAS domain-containing protein [Gemmobacter aquarius]AWB48994.1 anti-sigma factor antagonist [Gemmobacter aquarius]
MHFATHILNGITFVTPDAARLDASTAPALREMLVGCLDAGAQSVVLDLTGVTFLDSSALGALIAAAKRAGRNGPFAVCGVQPAVARLFALTHMDRVFTVHPSKAEALARSTA